jgi:hypothetical protein
VVTAVKRTLIFLDTDDTESEAQIVPEVAM